MNFLLFKTNLTQVEYPPIGKNFFVKWYLKHGRNFPWRNDCVSPFHILITEMLLRKTRAESVNAIWGKFTKKYPTPAELASGNRYKLKRQLKRLGLGNQRSEALLAASKFLVEKHSGEIPATFEDLMEIPHVGHYSSRAVLCFAFGEKIEIVDINVLKLFSRFYGIPIRAPDIRRNPWVWVIAQRNLPRRITDIKKHNYGILDFVAEICKSRGPRCDRCPLAPKCRTSP